MRSVQTKMHKCHCTLPVIWLLVLQKQVVQAEMFHDKNTEAGKVEVTEVLTQA